MPQLAAGVEPHPAVLGIDIAKMTAVVHDSVTSQTLTVANTQAGLGKALRRHRGHDLAVCEATGGHERVVLETARALGLPIHRADPARVKAFIASHGGHAKTDRTDARWLARFGVERGPGLARWCPPDPDHEAFAALVRHRRNLLNQRTAARNRHGAPVSAPLRDLLRAQIDFFTAQIVETDRRITALRSTPALAKVHEVLIAIPGIGPVVASSLIAFLPELGTLDRRSIASLAGLAPHPRDSGCVQGRRRTRGGRCELKSPLFMAALSAARTSSTLKPSYEKLVRAGKPKRVALTAIARRLLVIANAKVRDANTPPPKLT